MRKEIDLPGNTVWRVMNSRAVVPVKIVSAYTHGNPEDIDEAIFAETEHSSFMAFRSQAAAVKRARKLIDDTEHSAKIQLINVRRYRLNLEKSIKDYQE